MRLSVKLPNFAFLLANYLIFLLTFIRFCITMKEAFR